MSRAFVREPDAETGGDDEPLPPEDPHPLFLTPEGRRGLEERWAALVGERGAIAPDTADPGQILRRKRLARDIRLLERKRGKAVVIDPGRQPTDKVAFGHVIAVQDDDGRDLRFQIVGEDEARPQEGRISWLSPLAQALLGAGVDDRVVWRRPAGDVGLTILSISGRWMPC